LAYLDNVELQDVSNSGSNLAFETVNLETVAFEDDLSSSRVGDSLKCRLHLGRVDRRRGHEDVKRDRQEPERGDVELRGLQEKTSERSESVSIGWSRKNSRESKG
jgi:hypothetical protein